MMKKYSHFSKSERQNIGYMRDVLRLTYEEIANKLKRSKSSVYMEYKRNKENGVYTPCLSHDKYLQRLHKKDSRKIDSDPKILDYIIKKMQKEIWSPDVISAKIYKDIGVYISTDTIYNYIYESEKGRSLKLYKLLARKRPFRIKHGSRRTRVQIPNRESIHNREPVADEKLELGHFEGDLTFQKGNQSKNTGVLVDKKSQKVFLVSNSSKKRNTVTYGFSSQIRRIPKHLRKTIAFDNGKEFVSHMTYRLQGFKTYFCDAYSPWQKGLVEKINSMIHRIFPKNIDINKLDSFTLKKIENILNNMPRKILGYKTPNQVWDENI